MRSDVVSLVTSISPHHRLNDCSWLEGDVAGAAVSYPL